MAVGPPDPAELYFNTKQVVAHDFTFHALGVNISAVLEFSTQKLAEGFSLVQLPTLSVLDPMLHPNFCTYFFWYDW